MKKFFTLACAVLLAAPTFAQFTTGGSKSSKSTSSFGSTAEINDYNELGLSYTMGKYTDAGDDEYWDDDVTGNGLSIKYIHGFSVSKSLPMFVETGLNLSFGFGSTDLSDGYDDKYDGDINKKWQFAHLSIPVNFAYRFNVSETVAIKPFIGLNLKFNLLGRYKTAISGDYKDYIDDLIDDYKKYTGEKKDYSDFGYDTWHNLFSKDEEKGMGDKDSTWNRFQMGWHIGVDFQFNKFFIGLNYGTDFIPAFKYDKNKADVKINSQTFNLGIGVLF